MNQTMKPPMPKKPKSKMRQRISGRNGASAMFDTAEQTKMNEMMKKRKPRPSPKEMMMDSKSKSRPAPTELMMGGKVKKYKAGGSACGTKKMASGGKVRGAGCATKGVRPAKMR